MRRTWDFDDGPMGFRYDDDVFKFTSEPRYVRGDFKKSDGAKSGALELKLGGRDDDVVTGMSGGWSKDFRLDEAQDVTLTFRFKVTQSADYLSDEFTELRLSLDGDPFGVDGRPFFARTFGDGEGGAANRSGWRTVEIDFGLLDAGRHEFTFGAYGNKKSSESAYTKITFDKVRLDAKSSAEPELGDFEQQVLKRTNAFREKHDLDPVRAEANLMDAAEDWSRDMAKGDFFRHSDLPGQFEQFGYSARGYGENIAAGYPTPKEVVRGWIDSPGHRANLLREDFEHIGIGHYYKSNDGGDARFGHYWTQIFGDPSNDYFG